MESFPELLEKYARGRVRLHQAQAAIAFALGGEAGSRLAGKLQMPISGDTLLRRIRKTRIPLPVEPTVIGVDDWAQCRGWVYGTIIVDTLQCRCLERHRVIDLLTDRSAETLAQWVCQEYCVNEKAIRWASGFPKGSPVGKLM